MRRGALSGLLLCVLLAQHADVLGATRVLTRRSLSISGRDFVLEQDGVRQPVQLRAGEVHYFRVPEVHWEDRLLRVRAMGLNTVSTYVPWNWHEQVEGVFDFSSDMKNLTRFVKIADRLGLLVILRPGPYICAEWDFGGLPAWLLRHTLVDNMKFRTSDPVYLSFVDRFWGELLPQVRPLLLEEGGPVAMVQLENEFGHFGNASGEERPYFDHLQEIARRHLGPNVILMSTDNAGHNAEGLGTMPGVLAATNLGPWSEAQKHLSMMLEATDRHNAGGPELVMELWSGWFQSWGRSDFDEGHFRENATKLLEYVQVLLDRNASFTLYMAHGGTNFGFWNSASALTGSDDQYNSSFVTSSYDYAAPISEEGRHGYGGDGVDKFAALRELLSRHRGPWEPPLAEEPPPPELADYGPRGPRAGLRFQRRVPLRDPAVLEALCQGGWQPEPTGGPTPMELHGQQAGLAFYRYRPNASHLSGDNLTSTGTALHRFAGELSSGSFLAREQQTRGVLKLKARDRVTVWSEDNLLQQAQLNTNYGKKAKLGTLRVSVPMGKRHKHADHLDILVEHLGRRAFIKRRTGHLDPEAYEDWKGMREAWLGGGKLEWGWQYCALPLADLHAFNGSVPEPSAESSPAEPAGPAFFQGRFQVKGKRADTFLRLDRGMWQAGTAFINGFNLGRYQRGARGPFDLYVPKSVLRLGKNDVVMLEMDPPADMTLERGALVQLTAERGPMLPSEG